MKIENGIITDFDNTLVATNGFVENHLKKTCQKIGISTPGHETLLAKLKENPPFEKIFTDLFGDNGEAVLAAYRENALETFYAETPGGNIFVLTLSDKGVPIVIVSNRVNKLADRLTQAGYKVTDFLAIIEANPKKPNAGAYDGATDLLTKNGVLRSNISILGDHPEDYLACPEDLKPNFVAVLTGLTTAEEFEKVGVAENKIWQSLKHPNPSTV